jgi:hypothetical protein
MKLKGNFMTIERANEAMAKLKGAGFTNSYIKIDDNNRNIKRNLADSNSAYGLSNLVIDPSDMKKSPLTCISPLINVTAGFSEFSDNNYMVVVDTDQSQTQNAKDIITSLGGKFQQDSLSIGRVKEDIGDLNQKFKDSDI